VKIMAATGANTGKLRNILGAMEFGRRNLTVDGPVFNSTSCIIVYSSAR